MAIRGEEAVSTLGFPPPTKDPGFSPPTPPCPVWMRGEEGVVDRRPVLGDAPLRKMPRSRRRDDPRAADHLSASLAEVSPTRLQIRRPRRRARTLPLHLGSNPCPHHRDRPWAPNVWRHCRVRERKGRECVGGEAELEGMEGSSRASVRSASAARTSLYGLCRCKLEDSSCFTRKIKPFHSPLVKCNIVHLLSRSRFYLL